MKRDVMASRLFFMEKIIKFQKNGIDKIAFLCYYKSGKGKSICVKGTVSKGRLDMCRIRNNNEGKLKQRI